MIYYVEPTEEEKIAISLEKELHGIYRKLEACQQSVQRIAFGAFMLGIFAGAIFTWLVYSAYIGVR